VILLPRIPKIIHYRCFAEKRGVKDTPPRENKKTNEENTKNVDGEKTEKRYNFGGLDMSEAELKEFRTVDKEIPDKFIKDKTKIVPYNMKIKL